MKQIAATFAVTCGIVGLLALVPIAPASADDVTDYADQNAKIVCKVLGDYPSVAGLSGILDAIEDDGFTSYEAGKIAGIAIYGTCPRYASIAEDFIAVFG